MQLDQLRNFVELASELNFRKTAERLGISQPSLTRQIAALENELGLELLVRQRGRILGLTVAGDSYLADARSIFRSCNHAAQLARDLAAGKTGRIRLGVCDDATTQKLIGALAASRSSLPNVRFDIIELTSHDQANALRRNEIDLGIVAVPVDDRDLETEFLWREEWYVAFSEGHSLSSLDRIACQDLAQIELILAHPQLAPGGHDHIRSSFLSAGIHPNVAIHALRRSTMIMLVAGGAGVTFVPAAVAHTHIPGLEFRPFSGGSLSVSAAFRASEPPGVAMQFLRIVQPLLQREKLQD